MSSEHISQQVPGKNEAVPRSPFTALRGVQTIVSVAVLMATLLTLWNPRSVFRAPSLADLLAQQTNQAAANVSQERRIGLLAGFWRSGHGKTCEDGLKEEEVTLAVVERAALLLNEAGYQVDVFEENDTDFLNYKGVALIAIYTGDCGNPPASTSGFMIASELKPAFPEKSNNLAACLAEKYANSTGLTFTYQIIPPDQPLSALFRQVDPTTPTVMIKIGALGADRDLLTKQTQKVAAGISAGLLCYIEQMQIQ